MKRINRVGERFERLVVISFVGTNKYGKALWNCQCDCGNIIKVIGGHLHSGNTKSCGCLYREMTAKRNLIHGQAFRNAVSKEYQAWCAMKKRCLNSNDPGYKYYGGRGIKICERWLHSFKNFLSDVGHPPNPDREWSIDRINNNGNYEPKNVQWATPLQQARNRRPTRSLS